MASLAYILPYLPGKEEVARDMLERLQQPGPMHDAYVASRTAKGITRETVRRQKTPDGSFAIIVLEGDDIGAALQQYATSDDAFDRQFREFVKEVHGIDLALDPPPDVVLVSDAEFQPARP